MSRVLDVYLHKALIGKLAQHKGRLAFAYHPAYVKAGKLALSLSLPLQDKPHKGDVVEAFFAGLLPDESRRLELARVLGVSAANSFSLLEIVGGECAGAVSLYPVGSSPPLYKNALVEVLNTQQLRQLAVRLAERPLLAGEDGLRLSLAGAQHKLAVGVREGKIVLVKDGAPTTHILKTMIAGFSDTVHNELFCLRLAARVGIEVPQVTLHTVDDTCFLLIERYDREVKNRVTTRLHQEDICQALGILPYVKYEREGGPTIAACLELLQNHSCTPARDQHSFLQRIVFNFLIGNADAHGKNFALLYKSNRPQLAPAYDLLSTTVYARLDTKMAMKIGGIYRPDDLRQRHWQRLVAEKSTAIKAFATLRYELAQRTLSMSVQLKAELENEGIASPIFAQIGEVIAQRCEFLRR